MKDSAKYLLFSKYNSKNIFVDTKNNVVIDVLDKIEDYYYWHHRITTRTDCNDL